MKKILLIGGVIVVLVIGTVGYVLYQQSSPESRLWRDRVVAAVAPVACPNVERPEPYASSYQGPLTDTHFHIPSIPDSPIGQGGEFNKNPVLGVNMTMGKMACTLEQEGTAKAFAFFPVYKDKGIREAHIEIVKQSLAKYSQQFIPFIMPPDSDNSLDGFPTVDATELQNMLAIEPGLFKGYGEIGLYARDNGGAAALPPDSERLTAIYPVLRQHNLVLYFHPGFEQKDNLRRALAANPDINFVFHGGHLIGFDEEKGERLLGDVEEILTNHPNAFYGVDELYGGEWLLRPDGTKEAFMAHFKDYESLLAKDIHVWKGFIERHPDQVVWGTDRGVANLWSVDTDVSLKLLHYSRAFIGRLDPAVQEKLAYKNAERIFSVK